MEILADMLLLGNIIRGNSESYSNIRKVWHYNPILVIMNKLYIFLNLWNMSMGRWFHPDHFKRILVWSKQYCVTFGNKYASQHPCTGSQSGEDLHSHHDLAFSAMINRKESNPDTAEYQHAECYGFSFIEGAGQVSGKESQSEAHKGQAGQVSQDTVKGTDWTLVANNDNVTMLWSCINVNRRRSSSQPDCTYNNLDENTNGNDVVNCPSN